MLRKLWLETGTALAACMLCTDVVWGEACEVTTRPANAQVPVVQGHSCYEFRGMPPGSIDWSCSNEDKSSTPRDKRKVASCPQGAVASCKATLTQESLANERSTSKEPGQATLEIPANAEVITWYYELPEQAQARIDCEQTGGTFSSPLR